MTNLKLCKNCKGEFKKIRMGQKDCSPKCAIERMYSDKKKKTAKADRKALRAFNDKDRGQWLKKAQTAFNGFIRARDRHLGCISCGTTANVQYCAGHFRTVGAAPELRFEELNVHQQCNRYCNSGLSGNIRQYRPALIEKIGIEKVEWLEGLHEPKKYNVDDLKEITHKYLKLSKNQETDN